MFSKEIYQKRRQRLAKDLGSGVILFQGNKNSPMNFLDNYYHFRQDSSFLYFFGISRPNLHAVVDVDNNREIIFGENYTADDIIWMGSKPTLEELAEKCGVQEVLPTSEMKMLKSRSSVHYLPPYRDDHTLKLNELLAEKEIKKGHSIELVDAIIAQRSIKTVEEAREMNKATITTSNMHIEAMRRARAGMTEHEITGIVHSEALAGGGNISFPIILSQDSQILHNHTHENILEEGRLLLVDAGAENNMGYAGDMTRTFPVSSHFTHKQEDIYSIVLEAQETAINALKPGVPYQDIHMMVGKVITEGLTHIGLMKGNIEDSLSHAAFALFMPHGLGHMIGLDVHDMENLGEERVGYDEEIKRSNLIGVNHLRMGKKLEPGHAITVEPGIYFMPHLIKKWKSENKLSEFINYDKIENYHDFGGIRIEDDYLIDEKGAYHLGNPVPKTITEIEEIRSQA